MDRGGKGRGDWGVINVTLIQKALRLCRGFWGNTPLAITSQRKGGKGRGVQVCAPRLPPNK